MISDKRIDQIKTDVYGSDDIPDDIAARYAVYIDSGKALKSSTEEEFGAFQKGLVLALLLTAIEKKDRTELKSLLDWSLINYDKSRDFTRKGLVNSALESWERRDYLKGSGFVFNPNSKKIDTALSKITRQRISTFNTQEHKRISVIMREARKQSWTDDMVAREIKRGAGLNSVQQKALYNLQRGMMTTEGMTKELFRKRSDEYIQKALNYRATLTAKWEAATVMNTGHALLWDQLVDEKLISEESEKEWVAILDHVTGVPDKAMHRQKVPISAKFVDPTLTYAPIDRPPLRGNCRCDMRLIPKGV